ncbi:hypothetical protein CCYA_CCYA11G3212 [Cyanidiococcus yangmingshanensis]|nr:hypothetical protein CCYA_CCYA11G3212 [Cyanidiococcus yangmingshanensis]
MAAATWRAAEFLLRLNFERYETRLCERYIYLEAAESHRAIGKVFVSTVDETFTEALPRDAPPAPVGRRRLLARVFEHPARSTEAQQGTGEPVRDTLGVVVLIHGLSPSGLWDKRIEAAARAIACLGFTAVVPDFVEFRECRMSLSTLDDIAWAVVAIARGFRQDSVSLFAACIAAGYTLCAVLRNGEHVRQHVRAVMCIGPYADVEEMVWCTMLSETADAYGRNAIFYNFLRFSSLLVEHGDADITSLGPEWLPQLLQALRLALEDSHFLRENTEMAQLPRFFQELHDEDRQRRGKRLGADGKLGEVGQSLVQELYEQLQHDKEFRKLHTMAMLSHPTVREIMKTSQAIEAVSSEAIDFLVALVHGERDDIVPYRESRRLYCAMLRNRRCKVRPLCEVTSLLTHGDRQRLNWWTDMPKIVRLVRVFSQFFAYAARPKAPTAQPLPVMNESTRHWRAGASHPVRTK